MATTSRKYAVHGLRLQIEAESASLVDCFDTILQPFVAAESWRNSYVVHMRYGTPRPTRSAPRGMRRVWRGTPPGGGYSIFYAGEGLRQTDLPGLARIIVDLPQREARVTVKRGAEGCLSRNVITPLLCEFLGEAGQHVIHAASLAAGNGDSTRAVLLAGRSGLGKTTTALALAHSGLCLMADDASFIGPTDLGGLGVWGLPRPCKVHKKTFNLMPWLEKLPRRPAPTQDECLIDVAALPRANALQSARPGLIFFLDRRNARRHRVNLVDKTAALLRLTRENVRAIETNADGPAGRAFDAIAELVQQSDAYLLSVGPRLDGLFDHIAPLLEKTEQ
jgi:hypothetical protein